MVRPAGWSGCGSSPTVLPSRRGGIIGRLKGATFESKLTLPLAPQSVAAPCSPASQLLWPSLTSLGFSSLVSELSFFRCGLARQRGGLETSQVPTKCF